MSDTTIDTTTSSTPPPPEVEDGGELVAGLVPDSVPGKVYVHLISTGTARMPASAAASGLKRYMDWCTAQGFEPSTAPDGALQRFAAEAWKPAGQNASAQRLLKTMEVATSITGTTFSKQTYSSITFTRPKKTPSMNTTTEQTNLQPGGEAPPPPPPANTTTAEQPAGAPPAAAPPPVVVTSFTRAAPERSARTAAPPRKPTLLPTGGRLRIFKVATGVEGSGIAPGQRVQVGIYHHEDVSSEASIRDFIQRYVVSKYGPFPGHPDTVYVVELISDKTGQVQDTFEFAFAAPGFMDQGMPQVQPVARAAPPAGGGPVGGGGGGGRTAEDRFLDYLLEEKKKGEERFEQFRREFSAKQNGGQMDAATLLLLERMKPEPLDIKSIMAEFRAGNVPPPAPAPVPLPMDFGPTRGGRFNDDLFGPPAPPPAPVQTESHVLADTVTRLTDMVVASKQAPTLPVAAPSDPLSHPLLLRLADKVLGSDSGGNAMILEAVREMRHTTEKMMEGFSAALKEIAKPPEKSKSIAEALGDVKEMRNAFREIFVGDEEPGPSAAVEVVGMLLENADKVGNLIRSLQPTAPQLPQGQKQLPAGQPQGQPAPVVLPKEAQEAIVAIVQAPEGEAGEQVIANGLYGLIYTLSQSGEPWTKLSKLIVAGFLEANSKPELRALVTSVFTKTGAKKLASDGKLIERVTGVLHKHYSFLYSNLSSGQNKVLADAQGDVAAESQPIAEAPAAPAPAPSPAPVTAQAAPKTTLRAVPKPQPAAKPAPAPAPVQEDNTFAALAALTSGGGDSPFGFVAAAPPRVEKPAETQEAEVVEAQMATEEDLQQAEAGGEEEEEGDDKEVPAEAVPSNGVAKQPESNA